MPRNCDPLWGAKVGARFAAFIAIIVIFIRVVGGPEGWARKVHTPFVGTLLWQFFGYFFAGVVVGALYRLTRTAMAAALVGACAALPMSLGYHMLKDGSIGNIILVSGGTPWSELEWMGMLAYALLFGGPVGVMFYYQFAGRRKQLESQTNGRSGTG